jgi:hypothetical protein
MNTSPPYGSPYPQPPTQGHSAIPRYVVYGCITVVLLLVIGGIAGWLILSTAFTHLVESFTSDRPMVVSEVRMSAADIERLHQRIREFANGLSTGTAAEPLVLNADEINALVQDHLRSTSAPVAAEVRILGRQLEGEVSIPLEGRDWPLDGRYLNGKVVFAVGVVDGRAAAYIKDLRVGDRYIPDLIREELSKEDILRDVYKEDSDLSRALSRIKSIEIGDGKVVLSPTP